jgi:hypothetical protein
MEVNYGALFWADPSSSPVRDTIVSEEHTASIFITGMLKTSANVHVIKLFSILTAVIVQNIFFCGVTSCGFVQYWRWRQKLSFEVSVKITTLHVVAIQNTRAWEGKKPILVRYDFMAWHNGIPGVLTSISIYWCTSLYRLLMVDTCIKRNII